GDEVQGPAFVRCHGDQHRRPGPHSALAAATAAHHELFFAVDPEQALVIDLIPFPPQQDVQAPIAEPSPLVGNGFHPIAQHDVIGPKRLVAHRHPATSQYSARPPLAHPIGSLEMGDSIPLGGGRYHFFPRRSFSAALSSMLSASSFLSRAFSSSRAFRRRASLTSMPPYLAFHL